jgi:hypothetical protein
MPRTKEKYFWTYDDIQRLTEVSYNSLCQATTRGDLNPEDLRSIVLYVARHGTLELKREILDYCLNRILTEKPGRRKGQRKIQPKQ